jgi:ribosomal protein S18 acetylase RimI-like enzyme
MNVELIRATPDDVPEYLRIQQTIASRFTIITTEAEEALSDFASYDTYMIRSSGRSVGVISYEWRDVSHAHIDEFAVESAWQGKGIGTFAFEAVMARLASAKVITLVTHPENPARRLYERFGFRATGVRIENYHESGEPRIEMSKTLA